MTLLEKEPVKRVEKTLKEFNPKQSIIILDSSARTALEQWMGTIVPMDDSTVEELGCNRAL